MIRVLGLGGNRSIPPGPEASSAPGGLPPSLSFADIDELEARFTEQFLLESPEAIVEEIERRLT